MRLDRILQPGIYGYLTSDGRSAASPHHSETFEQYLVAARKALEIHALADGADVKVALRDVQIAVFKNESGGAIAVAYASGSPIVKSLRRMVRRALGVPRRELKPEAAVGGGVQSW